MKFFVSFTSKLRERFPTLANLYNQSVNGIIYFRDDRRKYLSISRNERNINFLSFKYPFKTTQCLVDYPTYRRKILPIFILWVLPIFNNFAYAYLFFFPKHAVTHHFLKNEQWIEFRNEKISLLKTKKKIVREESHEMCNKLFANWTSLKSKTRLEHHLTSLYLLDRSLLYSYPWLIHSDSLSIYIERLTIFIQLYEIENIHELLQLKYSSSQSTHSILLPSQIIYEAQRRLFSTNYEYDNTMEYQLNQIEIDAFKHLTYWLRCCKTFEKSTHNPSIENIREFYLKLLINVNNA